jgi:hypothetical protein
VRTNANSARWYLSPGHAVAGAANIAHAGRVWQYTQGRARAEQGTATSGVLNYGVSNGAQPFSFQGVINNNIYSEIDNKVRQDVESRIAVRTYYETYVRSAWKELLCMCFLRERSTPCFSCWVGTVC